MANSVVYIWYLLNHSLKEDSSRLNNQTSAKMRPYVSSVETGSVKYSIRCNGSKASGPLRVARPSLMTSGDGGYCLLYKCHSLDLLVHGSLLDLLVGIFDCQGAPAV